MGFISVLTMAQRLVAERIGTGCIAVDATAGNGVDTLFLARTAGPKGRVYSFDLQESALARTKQRLADEAIKSALAPVTLIHAGHERMAAFIPEHERSRLMAVMFNLGYLPGGDPAFITQPDTTLAAMAAALDLLAPGGVMTAVLYPGHAGGKTEAEAVAQWAASMPVKRGQTMQYRFTQKPDAPYLVALEKRK